MSDRRTTVCVVMFMGAMVLDVAGIAYLVIGAWWPTVSAFVAAQGCLAISLIADNKPAVSPVALPARTSEQAEAGDDRSAVIRGKAGEAQ